MIDNSRLTEYLERDLEVAIDVVPDVAKSVHPYATFLFS